VRATAQESNVSLSIKTIFNPRSWWPIAKAAPFDAWAPMAILSARKLVEEAERAQAYANNAVADAEAQLRRAVYEVGRSNAPADLDAGMEAAVDSLHTRLQRLRGAA
jgi:hypothetical protein